MPTLKRTLPVLCGDTAVNFFRNTFREGGFDDSGLKKWKEVNRRIEGTRAYKYAKKSARNRAILVKSGNLKRGNVRKSTSWNRTVIANEIPYAKYHNEGIGYMPKRQFMGNSKTLTNKTVSIIKNEIDKLLKK